MSRADIVEVQYSPNSGVDRKTKAGMKNNLIEGHLARASRHYGLIVLGEPGLDPGRERYMILLSDLDRLES